MFRIHAGGKDGIQHAMDADVVSKRNLFRNTARHMPMDWYRFDVNPEVDRQLQTKNWQLVENLKEAENRVAPDAWQLACYMNFYRSSAQAENNGTMDVAQVHAQIEKYLTENLKFSKSSDYKVSKKGSRLVQDLLLIFDRVKDAKVESEMRESRAMFARTSIFYQHSIFLCLVQKCGTSAAKMELLVHLAWVRLQRGTLSDETSKAMLQK